MFFNEQVTAKLKRFLVEELTAVSEADPAVLSDYVIALLRHDKPVAELKHDCEKELEDFLAESKLISFKLNGIYF